MVIPLKVRADVGVVPVAKDGLECRAGCDAAQRLDTIGGPWTETHPRNRETCNRLHSACRQPWSFLAPAADPR